MRKVFYASLCYKGIRGGAIFVDEDSVEYRNQSLTLPSEYKDIIIKKTDIVKKETGLLCLLPTVTLYTTQTKYRFVIFHRKKFLQELS